MGRGMEPHPIESLRAEHAVIRRLLAALSGLGARLERDPVNERPQLARCAQALGELVQLFHHDKEEEILLPALARHGLDWGSGPAARVRQEHEQEAYLARVLEQAAEQVGRYDPEDLRHAVKAIRAYVEFVGAHLAGEEAHLFPAAEAALDGAAAADVARQFAAHEAHRFGGHRYADLLREVDRLHAEYAPAG
ncbi:MAG: hemerythrin domain-containing protein [Deltaproteobacteria bacterium]|nr:hemerythrin domain-containing protein [Deltaproteobacteria bacterium]